MLRNKRIVGVVLTIVVLLLAVTVPAAEAATPTAWQLTVGASTSDQAAQANFFIPGAIWIHAGDSITWSWNSGEIHTVTFGGFLPNPGGPFAPWGGTPNEATYTGSNQVSSGAKAAGLGGTYTVTFPNAGNYQFNCMVHPSMSGWVHVLTASQSLPHAPAWYVQQAHAQDAVRIGYGFGLEVKGQQIAGNAGPLQVQAGYGQLASGGAYAILRFAATHNGQPLTIKAGQTVTFTNRDPETPHTITFNLDYANVEDAFFPSGNVSNGQATMANTSTQVNSGLIGVYPDLPMQGTTFSVTFATPGTYNFHCELHDTLGMTGQIIVTN